MWAWQNRVVIKNEKKAQCSNSDKSHKTPELLVFQLDNQLASDLTGRVGSVLG